MFFTDPQFLKAALERAVKTVAQTVVAMLATDLAGVLDVDWTAVGSAAALAGVVSLLTSVGSGFVGERETPSVSGETLSQPREPYVPLSDDDLDA